MHIPITGMFRHFAGVDYRGRAYMYDENGRAYWLSRSGTWKRQAGAIPPLTDIQEDHGFTGPQVDALIALADEELREHQRQVVAWNDLKLTVLEQLDEEEYIGGPEPTYVMKRRTWRSTAS